MRLSLLLAVAALAGCIPDCQVDVSKEGKVTVRSQFDLNVCHVEVHTDTILIIHTHQKVGTP